jgi:hypothetical protein
VKHFKDGNGDIVDLHHTSRSRTSTMEYNTQKVDALTTEDQSVTTRTTVLLPRTEQKTMQVMIETLKYRKVCRHWVPQLLMDKHERACVHVSSQLLQHAAEGNDFLLNIVTGDES